MKFSVQILERIHDLRIRETVAFPWRCSLQESPRKKVAKSPGQNWPSFVFMGDDEVQLLTNKPPGAP